MKTTIAVITFLLFATACKQQTKDTLFTLMDDTGINFANNIHDTRDFNIFTYRNFYNGGGVAIGDVNNDGLSDVFFTANMGANKLYLNKGNWKFDDVTDKAGIINKGKWGTGVVMVDINGDGWLDIYVCNAGYQTGITNENELYINQKNGTFKEAAKQYGLDETGYTTHAAFFDYDLDGDLDCYILKNSFIPVNTLNYANKRELRAKDWPVADFLKGGGAKLFQNDNGKFIDVSEKAGIYGSLIGFGLGVTVGDVNGDLYPDLYISNDFFERDYLYINQQNGTFKEDLENRMQHISHSSMGADIADINNDGYPDIFTTDMLPFDDARLKTTTTFESIDVKNVKTSSGFYNQYMQNTLQINNKNGKFLETAYYSGVAASDWSWGGLIFDADNDGLSDLYVCNGINHDVTDQDFIDFFANDVIQNMVMTGQKEEVSEIINKMPSHPIPNRAFRNNGKLKFTDEAKAWGLDQPSFSNGAAYGDLDNDGDLDLVVNNVNQAAFVYQNNSRQRNGGNYIGFQLKAPAPNTFAVGSTIKVFADSQVFTRELIPSRGFQSSVDYKVLVGIGTHKVDSVQVIWPNKTYVTMLRPAINQVHQIAQSSGAKLYTPPQEQEVDSLLQLVSAQYFQRHVEDPFIDFYYERGLPMMLSHEGPKAAVGDVNGDGLDDVFICGAARQPGAVFLQTRGGFAKKENPVFLTTQETEGTAAVFFDADGDGDNDLLVGAGGNRFPAGHETYQNILYLNDGKGNFSISTAPFPLSGVNTACLAVNDVDGDGDLDVFAGTRSIPYNYGLPPKSFLYINDGGGRFTAVDVPQLNELGFVTSAVWVDMDGDRNKELVVAAEWKSPTILSFKSGKANRWQTSLDPLKGWWKSVTAADLDGDGDQDLVLGNLGENFYLSADSTGPVKMFAKDFDANGSVEKIFTRSVEGKDKPVFMKRDLTDQIASLRKQNLKNTDYATKTVEQIFTTEQLKDANVYQFTFPSSIVAWNGGGGKFTVQKLPYQAQLSCVNAIVCTDVNADGKPDLILGTNQFNFLPQFSQLDASYGQVLLNKGRRFEVAERSGMEIKGEVRDIVSVGTRAGQNLLFLQNNDVPLLYRIPQFRLAKK